MNICPRPAARYVWDRWPRFFEALRREQLRQAKIRRTPAPASGMRAEAGMEIDDDPLARVRKRRFNALVGELLPHVRRFNPQMPDEQVLEMAESMAELRLLDEEIDA